MSPDNRSRTEINTAIHRELQKQGIVDKREHAMQVLVPRQELTGADRSWAQRYQPNDGFTIHGHRKKPASKKGSMPVLLP